MNEPFPYVCALFVLCHVMMHIEGLAQVHLCNRSGLFYSRGGLHALFETSEFLCFRQKEHRSPPTLRETRKMGWRKKRRKNSRDGESGRQQSESRAAEALFVEN
ncbi:hypothetical protein ATANTOWER_014954 [Ataeniobius toweri]|uniref:Secreted protein n=1 Tax=Ataeniobius toweri TaxID=208326 RepID=A0ABU7C1P9_9TELE|nr:hypothetical protein [Ataeniobius toweri]